MVGFFDIFDKVCLWILDIWEEIALLQQLGYKVVKWLVSIIIVYIQDFFSIKGIYIFIMIFVET